MLKRAVPDAQPQPLRVKIDPGSRISGLAVMNDATGQVVWAAELTHHGQQIHSALVARQSLRRGRRQRNTRYRPARFANRRRREGWMPPSLESRVSNLLTWTARLRRLAPIATLSQELVRFDTQLLQNAEISGVEYQRGELAGYEVREYVLEKWGPACAYCHRTGVPLELDHIVPRSRPGTSHRVSNLAPACRPCNQEKGDRTAAEFGHPEVQAKARQPLQDVAAVNASRWALFHRLVATGLPVEVGTGGRTKWNRTVRGLPKTHWIDAACVGASTPKHLACANMVPLEITAMGRHSRQMRRTNAFGFPDKAPKAVSVVAGLRTGDIVRAVVPPPSVKAGSMWGAWRCAPPAPAISRRALLVRCKAFTSAIASRSSAGMAIPIIMATPTRKESKRRKYDDSTSSSHECPHCPGNRGAAARGRLHRHRRRTAAGSRDQRSRPTGSQSRHSIGYLATPA